jgi:hypothetical protein
MLVYIMEKWVTKDIKDNVEIIVWIVGEID